MPGPAPSENRRRRNTPARGDWQTADGTAWRFGDVPAPPDGLKDVSLWAWQTWFGAWFAAYWTPDDVPGLRQLIRLYDEVERGGVKAADRSELRQLMDNYGITPKGQQDRRWKRPTPQSTSQPTEKVSRYRHLRSTG